MAIFNVIQFSNLEGALRIEAEFYKPGDLTMLAKLRSLRSKELGYYCIFIKKGIFDLPPSYYTSDGIPLIRTTEIKSTIADLSSVARIPFSIHRINSKTELEPGDIVFTKIGANIGDVSILPSTEKVYNFSQNVAGAKIDRNKIMTEYLACFLSTKYGKFQIKRIQMLSGQGKLELVDIKKILIPPTSDKLQKFIADIYYSAESLLALAKEQYAQAEQLLLSELGLCDWKPRHTLTYVRSFNQVKQANRMDAEHFQPKYEEVLTRISQYAPKSIASFGSQVLETIKLDENKIYRYIEISDVNIVTGEVEFTERAAKELPANAKIKVAGGELIVSKVRPTRGAIGIIPNECRDNGVCSNAFVVLKIPSPEREFLQVYLRSTIGKTLLEKPCKGTSYPTIDDNDVKLLPVPTITQSKIEQISHLVQQSHTARRESKALLEKAKRAVEIAIEEGEERAMEFLS